MNRTAATVIMSMAAALTVLIPACAPQSTPSPTPTVALSQYQLGYRLLAAYSDFFWCDPDFYPVVSEGQEQLNASEGFSTIRANAAEFTAILTQLNLPDKASYTDAEKLSLYREHKKLTLAIQMNAAANGYDFVVRTGQNQ